MRKARKTASAVIAVPPAAAEAFAVDLSLGVESAAEPVRVGAVEETQADPISIGVMDDGQLVIVQGGQAARFSAAITRRIGTAIAKANAEAL